MSTFEERLRNVLQVVAAHVWWDQTPDKIPEGDFIILSRPSGRAAWYVDNSLPDHDHARVQITGFCARSEDRELMAKKIEVAMATSNFAAVEPYGNWRGFSEPTMKKYCCLWQFGVWYKPDVP